MFDHKKILIILLALTFTLSGCFISFNKAPETTDGGVFKSIDGGETWHQKPLMPTVNGNVLLNRINVLSITMDPQDHEALYVASRENGIFFSYSAAESWFQPRQVAVGRIEDVKVSPDSKCIVYASQRNNIYKTTDCSRTWQNIFVDPRSEVVVTALAVDPFDTSVVYAGNSSGDVMKSTDYGVSWKTVNRLGDKVAKIIVYPEDSDIVYVATQKKGISKSLDEGITWEDLSNSFGEYNGALNYKQLIFSPSEEHALIHASEYGLLKSTDGAQSWQSLRLITPAKGVTAMAVAVDPEDSDRIFYTNGNTLLYSVDAGVNWKSKKLDTSRWASYLLIDPENTKVMYMGTLMPSGKR